MSMPLRPRTGQFGTIAKWFHWVVAFLVLSILSVALTFPFVPLVEKQSQFPTHASIGVIIVVLTLLRLTWRKLVRPPALPETTPGWMKRGARTGHRLLYALILYQGVLGFWLAAISPADIRFFNGWNISALAPANIAMMDVIRPFHLLGAIALSVVIFGHIMGALWHHFRLRDDVLVRMLPFSGLWYRLTAEDYARGWRFPSSRLARWPRRLSKDMEELR